jgi:hypothetical protein
LRHVLNVNPDLVGVGAVTEDPAVTVDEVGETVPPFASQVTVYCTIAEVVIELENAVVKYCTSELVDATLTFA